MGGLQSKIPEDNIYSQVIETNKAKAENLRWASDHPAIVHIPVGHVMALRSKIQNIVELIEAHIFISKVARRVALFFRLTLRGGRGRQRQQMD